MWEGATLTNARRVNKVERGMTVTRHLGGTTALACALLSLASCNGVGTGQYIFGKQAFQCGDELVDPYGAAPWTDVEASGFDDLDLEEQRGEELCWAAAIGAILAYNDVERSQEEIVQRVRGASKGGTRYNAATLSEIIGGIGGSWHVSNGDSRQLVDSLYAEYPVLVGLRGAGDMGHVVVAYGAEYVRDPWGRVYVSDVEVWDPARGFDRMDGCDFKDSLSFVQGRHFLRTKRTATFAHLPVLLIS